MRNSQQGSFCLFFFIFSLVFSYLVILVFLWPVSYWGGRLPDWSYGPGTLNSICVRLLEKMTKLSTML